MAGLQNRQDPDCTTFLKNKMIRKCQGIEYFAGLDNMPECTTSGFNKFCYCGIPNRTDIDLSTTKREDAIGIHRRIHASCPDRYFQFGSGRLICQSNGKWKYDIHCEEKEWIQYLDHIYFHFNYAATWAEAKVHCESFDAYLVAINTENENDWLLKTFVEKDIGSKEGCINVFLCGSVWTGGTDIAEEDNFVWTRSNERVNFQRWAPFNPGKGNDIEDCIRFLVDGSWSDYNCAAAMSFICEKNIILNK